MSNYRRFYISGNNYIFFTVVTYKRMKILIDNIDLLRKSFKYALRKYKFKIVAIVILNDHFHMILNVENIIEFPKILYTIKNYFSRKIDNIPIVEISESATKRKEKGIWQRRYWEHTIRDENDLHKHIDYIHYNSIKHYNIIPKDWKYSSFKKFTKLGFYNEDWCKYKDENEIKNLDSE